MVKVATTSSLLCEDGWEMDCLVPAGGSAELSTGVTVMLSEVTCTEKDKSHHVIAGYTTHHSQGAESQLAPFIVYYF